MKEIDMTAEEFRNFLTEKEEELDLEFDDDGIYRDDLKNWKIDYFILDEKSDILHYFFHLNDGFVSIRSDFQVSKLDLKTWEKVDDHALRTLLAEKQKSVERINEINIILEHYRLKTLFL